MEEENIIEKYYLKATSGINEQMLELGNPEWYQYVTKLSSKVQITYTIVVFINQVLNGGYDQYFYNRYGQFAFKTIENLKIIGAFSSAEILERATEKLNKNINKSEFILKINSRLIDELDDPDIEEYLNRLTEQQYSIDEDPIYLLKKYLNTDS